MNRAVKTRHVEDVKDQTSQPRSETIKGDFHNISQKHFDPEVYAKEESGKPIIDVPKRK